MNYGEFQKLYPQVRIPYAKEAQYYIDLLLEGGVISEQLVDDFVQFEKDVVDVAKYKKDKMNEIIDFLNTVHNISAIMNYNDVNYDLSEFGNFREGKLYVSLDLKEANWTAYKYLLDYHNVPRWEEWVTKNFDIHPALAKSKSFRQFIFGNTNPKRIASGQKAIMASLVQEFSHSTALANVVAYRPDELLFEMTRERYEFLQPEFLRILKMEKFKFKFRETFFKVREIVNLGDFVRTRHTLNKDEKGEFFVSGNELIGVPGNRFFVHYKTLILKQELEERDLLFKQDKHLAKWVIPTTY